jgi:hypothetical protein
MKNGGWLDAYDDVPQAENGIEGTMGGLTDKGFNYNGAWGGTMAMGGSMPGAVGFTYARTGSIPSNGKYAKKTKASAQDGRAISDNTRLKPIVTEKPMNRETISSSNDSYVMSPQEALLNKLKGVRLKESQDRLNKTAEKITAVGSLSPNPLIGVPSTIANFTLGAMNSPTPTDRGLDYLGLFGSTPSSLNSFKKIGRRAPFFKAIGAADALSDIFEFTPSEDLPKKQNGGEMKYYQEGLDWKPRNISQEGSKTPKKRTLVLAEHNPEFWGNPDGSPATNINPFIKEAAGIKKYVNKYFPGEDVEVIPTYKQNIKEALAKSDPNTRLVVMGHSGNRMFGIPTTEFIESVGNTKYENCYAGICHGDILPGIGKKNPDKELIGKMIPRRFPESYNLQNFNVRSNDKQWVGFAPVDRGGEEGFKDSFFRRTKNPEVTKLQDQLNKIWLKDGDYDEKVKSSKPIEDKINKIYSQNKQTVNLPKAADTKELDYIPIPARTANYGNDPLRFNPQALLQNRRDGGEIPQAQDGLRQLLTQPTGDIQSYYPELKRIKEAPKVAETKKAAADRANLERVKSKATYVKPGPSETQSRINRQQATELAKQEALQNSPLSQTLGSLTPSGYNPGAGAIGAETFVNMAPVISVIPSSIRLAQLSAGNDPYGFNQENIISSENALASLGALGDVANVALPVKIGAKARGYKEVQPTSNNSVVSEINQMFSNLNPKNLKTQSGTDWMKRWYSDSDFARRYYPTGEYNPSFMQIHILEQLNDYQPKNYLDLLKDKGLPTYLNQGITSGGVSWGVPKSIYINRPIYAPFNKKGLESVRTHELTHLIENNGRLLSQTDEAALLKPFGISNRSEIPNPGFFKREILGDNPQYYLDPTEIHARMNQARFDLGLSPKDVFTEKMFNEISKKKDWYGMGKRIKDKEEFIHLMNNFWAVPPAIIGGAAALEQKKKGGKIKKDDMGYWNPENWGEPVEIDSNEITMDGVYEPLLGISDTGDVQMMYPGEDYTFDGETVTEYPIAKSGMSVNNADAQPIEKLDQLLNFTNYNKPTKGGWLDKYK